MGYLYMRIQENELQKQQNFLCENFMYRKIWQYSCGHFSRKFNIFFL